MRAYFARFLKSMDSRIQTAYFAAALWRSLMNLNAWDSIAERFGPGSMSVIGIFHQLPRQIRNSGQGSTLSPSFRG